MNTGQFIAEIRKLAIDAADSPDARRYTDDEIVSQLNEVQDDFASQTKLLKKQTIFPTVAGTRDYALASRFMVSRQIVWDIDSTKRPIRFTEDLDFELGTSTGDPDVAYIWNERLHLYPTPNRIVNVLWRFWALPVPLAASAPTVSSELPEIWHQTVKNGAVASVLSGFEDEERANRYQLLYQRGLERAKQVSLFLFDGEPAGLEGGLSVPSLDDYEMGGF